MIIHTVTFKTKHPSGSQEEQDFIRSALELGKLPMVVSFECYRQIGGKNNFDFGFFVTFQTAQDYESYNIHPDHVEFVESKWKPEVVDFLELDYVKYDC